MHTHVELKPGVYRKEGRPARTLISVVGPRCVYTFADVDRVEFTAKSVAQPIPVTICSARTFTEAVGTSPTREFSPEEQKNLSARVISRVPYRKCNRLAKLLFFPNGSHCKWADLARLTVANPPQTKPAVLQEEEGRETREEVRRLVVPLMPSLAARIGAWFKRLFHPATRVLAPSTA